MFVTGRLVAVIAVGVVPVVVLSAAGVPGWIALAVPAAVGILVTQLAAWRAARKAARISPMQALRAASADTTGRRWPRLAGAFAVFACAWMFFGPVWAIRAEEPPGPDRTVGIARPHQSAVAV